VVTNYNIVINKNIVKDKALCKEVKMLKNRLNDLQNHLFSQIELLNDDTLEGEKLETALKRSLAMNELAKTAVTNAALMVKAVDLLYGIPIDEEIPLLPIGEGDKYLVSKKNKGLTPIPQRLTDAKAMADVKAMAKTLKEQEDEKLLNQKRGQ
jgi:hypothetical protein